MPGVPVVIDFSASSLGRLSYPIEVGFSQRHGDGWCTLIRPEPEWSDWDPAHHKIGRELLLSRGRPALLVADQLNLHLSGKTVYSYAWNYDCFLLARLFDAAKCQPQFKLADFREIISPEQQLLWQHTQQHVVRDLNVTRRRASSSAKVLQMTWLLTYDAVKTVV